MLLFVSNVLETRNFHHKTKQLEIEKYILNHFSFIKIDLFEFNGVSVSLVLVRKMDSKPQFFFIQIEIIEFRQRGKNL